MHSLLSILRSFALIFVLNIALYFALHNALQLMLHFALHFAHSILHSFLSAAPFYYFSDMERSTLILCVLTKNKDATKNFATEEMQFFYYLMW